ncbi:TetR/AcrR family transcriptional regulator [Pseudonocardia sp. CA-107938]|uniref:TetR/AcrR family transcriptional regulator n=1 Tax=Pseudonocardia sp. CA-107938 TaxID=3240021 RepID=UPI003D9373B3
MVSATSSTAGRVIRRPRMTPGRQAELLHAALDALREVGYGGLSMELVASRAGCSKATLYRQWQTKARMVAAAVRASRPSNTHEIDTGSLRGDLLAMVTHLQADGEHDATLLAAVHHAVLTDETLALAMRTTVLEPVAAQLQRFVGRATDRGELTGRPTAAEFLHQLVFSLLMVEPIEGASVDDAFLTRFVDSVLLPALHHGGRAR